jgi:sn-glycerol 3-phosphate transport system ATP-binding protein
MSVFENMAYGLKIAKVPLDEIKTRVDKAAKILELGPYLLRKPRELSGGQRQRVAMGRAIVRQPQVFLFDEPLSNLDAKLRAHTRLEIQKLHRELGITSLFVTHDQVEAMTLAQRMIVMNAGVMEQFGTPKRSHAARQYLCGQLHWLATHESAEERARRQTRHHHRHTARTPGHHPHRLGAAGGCTGMFGAERLVYGRWLHGDGDELVIIRTDSTGSACTELPQSTSRPAQTACTDLTQPPANVYSFSGLFFGQFPCRLLLQLPLTTGLIHVGSPTGALANWPPRTPWPPFGWAHSMAIACLSAT